MEVKRARAEKERMDIIEDISCGVWCFVPDEVFRFLFVAAAVCVGCVSRSFVVFCGSGVSRGKKR